MQDRITPKPPPVLARHRPSIRRHLQSVFEGGPAGQRNAALLFLVWVAPISMTVTAVLASEHRIQIIVLRAFALAVGLCWLLLRPAFRFGEWVLLLALVTVTNVAGQLGAGSSHNGVLALNGLAVFALVCVAFESSLVVVAAALFLTGYAAIQLHFYGVGDAVAASVMYAVVLSVVALGVHGTALYLRESLRRTGELHAEMEHTAEQERARIAGELHDDTIQVLTAAGLRLDELVRRVEDDNAGSAASARDVRELIRHALDRTRRLSFELYPPQLDQRGLGAALDALGHQFETESTFEVAMSVGPARFPRAVEQLVFRTIKELLTNARKHSEARHVTVAVTSEAEAVNCVVEDDGLGFDPNAVADARRGFHIGLDAAAERVRSAGGRLEIASVPNRGTRATFTVPFRVGDP